MSYKHWIYIATGLFGIGITLGLVIPVGIADLFGEEMTALEELAAILGPFQIATAAFIFIKNGSALLVSFMFSPFLCLPPVIALVVNGGLLSVVSVAVVQEESLGLLLAGILPHGIIEIPALIIGEAAALSSGVLIISALFSKGKSNRLLPGLKLNLKYLLLACLLLLPAAFIETYVTPLLLT